MGNSISSNWMKFYDENILAFFQSLKDNPFSLFTAILDLAIVIFLLYAFFRMVKGSRAWQLIKGIAFLIIATWVSGLLNLNILNSILTGIMNWGVIALVVIFQPELRRGLEQLGTNKLTKFFGIQSDLATKTKEDVYKDAVLQIGSYEPFIVQEASYEKFKRIWGKQGLGFLVQEVSRKDKCIKVHCYYGSSTYDSKEMSLLIEWLVQEAKQHNIETKSKAELDSLVKSWGN